MATGKGAADAGIEHLRIGAGNAVADYTDDDIFVGQVGDILGIGEVQVGQRRNTVFGLDRADVVDQRKSAAKPVFAAEKTTPRPLNWTTR